MREMTIAILLVGLLLFLPAQARADEIPLKYRLNGNKVFYGIKDKATAVEKGKTMAQSDFSQGLYRRLQISGIASHDTGKKEIPGCTIYVVSVAGCIVSEGLEEGVRSYNQTMRELLKKRYERDVFVELTGELR